MHNNSKPPRIAEFILSLFMSREEENFFLGDFEEIYRNIELSEGKSEAVKWYWLHAFLSIPGLIKNRIYWSITMLGNYLKLAVRNIMKYKVHSAIKIFGFALSLASCILIYLYVQDELSYDKYQRDYERSYRIALEIKGDKSERTFCLTQGPLAASLKAKYPQIERIGRVVGFPNAAKVVYKDKSYYEEKIYAVDPEILRILDVPIINGEVQKGFENPTSVVISKKIAEKYFGSENPIGKSIAVGGKSVFEVCAVADDAPQNTFFKYNIFVPLKRFADAEWLKGWYGTVTQTYVTLKPGTDAAGFENSIKDFTHQVLGAGFQDYGSTWRFFIQPIKDIHLHSNLYGEMEPSGSPVVISVLSALALLILILACINFLNLTTAMSYKKSKEVGLRKVVGGNTKQLIIQFLSESVALAFISMIIALVVVILVTPLYNSLTGKNYGMFYVFRPSIIFTLMVVTIIIGIVSSLYPTIVISLFNPIQGIKSAKVSSASNYFLKKILLAVQFAIAFIFIVCTFYVYAQVDYMKNYSLGFDKEQKMIIKFRGNGLSSNFESVKADFNSVPGIINSTAVLLEPSKELPNWGFHLDEMKSGEKLSVYHQFADYDYIKSYGLKLLCGSDFDRNAIANNKDAFIINRAASKALGFSKPEDAIGKNAVTGNGGRTVRIIGVVEDFNYEGIQKAIAPLVIGFSPENFTTLTLTIETKNVSRIVENLEKKWKSRFPDITFEYTFLSDEFAALYNSEERLGKLCGVFAFVGLFISCIGLFGLISISAQQRKREIGIRKVLGSSEAGIVKLLTFSFLKWVLIGDLIALPVSYFLISKWLEDFAYKIEITALPFILIIVLSLLIALLTIGFQAYKAANANPTDILQYE